MKLNVIQAGKEPGTAQAVILLHGLFGSLSNLGGIAKHLAADFTTYQVDLRNHGQSPHTATMSYLEMANDIITLMDDQRIKAAHLLGHSMGGKVTMQTALSHPQRVNKLIVADIAPVAYQPTNNPALEGLLALQQTAIESRQQADQLLANYVDDKQVRAFLLKNLYRTQNGTFNLRLNLTAIQHHYQTLAGVVTGKAFTGPTLFLKGSESAYIQQTHQERIVSLFPQATIKIIGGTGHWLHSEKPETFNRLVQQFLNN